MQDDVFTRREADNYWERNKAGYYDYDPKRDFPLRLVTLYNIRPKKVLEVGGANGFRMAFLRKICNPEYMAVVEPSKKAIEDGRRRYPFVHFFCTTASNIPLEERFDLIVVNFVFHWIDRSTLLKSAAEVDRLCQTGGFLIVSDFYPDKPTKVEYHHLPKSGVYTFKQDYGELFMASRNYERIALLTGSHSSGKMEAEVEDMDKLGAWLLRKKKPSPET